ncbi:MAG TPA: transglutaminase-like domain-containing protein [Patescibacteria group bacterium]|nr:transglutaminase-like domain-containing protein [Patescibacteria group bacterium]
MRKLLQFFIVFFVFASSFFITTHDAHADTKVTSAVAMQYNVAASGVTHVTAHISLTNTTENYYVSSYTLKLGFENITNITASDPNGPITTTVKPSGQGQEITLTFNDVVAGKGKTLPFTLSFDTENVASENGTIWEVNIPGLASQDDFSDFSVDVSVPPSFGKATFIKPFVNETNLHFTKDDLGKSGISLAFGNSQTYAYSLTYHIENTNVFPVKTDIALPPTTNYQDVSLQSISPKPDNVRLDTDGNWLATYTLSPSQKLSISAAGLIAVSLTPKEVLLSDSDRKLYLQQQSFWQVNNSQIKTLATSLKTPEAIYNYVVTHLTYDFARVTNEQIRIGALGVLQNPSSAVCLEFTDLFIALSRAAGIPAREIDGFAYTQNTISRPLSLSKDVLHAWPEYYDNDKHTWVMVDPTWGNTTGGVDYFHLLDFDHVAFVVKGVSSTYPVPAGGYKFTSDQNRKDVSVDVTQETITDQPILSMKFTMPESVASGLPIGGSATLENTGSVLFPSQPMQVTTTRLKPLAQFVSSPAIPPFGTVTKQIAFDKTPFLTNLHDTITITLDGKSVTSSIAVVPVTRQILIIGGISVALFITCIWLIAKKPWRL